MLPLDLDTSPILSQGQGSIDDEYLRSRSNWGSTCNNAGDGNGSGQNTIQTATSTHIFPDGTAVTIYLADGTGYGDVFTDEIQDGYSTPNGDGKCRFDRRDHSP